MPLDKACTIDAFRENIRTEIRAGKSPEQAAAIARTTLEASCQSAGKPVPKSVSKGSYKKAHSREYLEAALAQAKKMLPGWMYAVIHRAAFPSSGGRAAANRRLSAMEKAWIEKGHGGLSDQELRSLWKGLEEVFFVSKRQSKDSGSVLSRAGQVYGEMQKRGLVKSLGEACPISKSDALLTGLNEFQKGFVTGHPEGGMHAHGLDRRNSKTVQDGEHIHLFVVPGTGEHLFTYEDGNHVHEILENGEHTDGPENKSGRHSHILVLPNGRTVETQLGGDHDHALMIETTGFGGEHTHRLTLPDGTLLTSVTVGEFVNRFLDQDAMIVAPAPRASLITGAVNELRNLKDQMFADPGMDLPSIPEVMDEFAKTGELPKIPVTAWHVEDSVDGGAVCSLSNTQPVLKSNSLKLAIEPGDIVDVDHDGAIVGFSKSSEPHSFDTAEALDAYVQEVRKATASVDFTGPQNAPLLFVGASPSPLEMARREALIGPDGALFQERYLDPLGLTKKDVAVGFAVPVTSAASVEDVNLWRDRLLKSVERYSKSQIVALGRTAKVALGPLAACVLPHPAALRRHGDAGEVGRKLKALSKRLDISIELVNTRNSPTGSPSQGRPGTTLTDAISELRKEGSFRIAVAKSVPEKQIVYSVILDPYQVDLHTDWVPPAETESTAHDFLEKSRIIGLRHTGQADAKIVESWVEIYPSRKDRDLAMQNLPHRVFRREFGNDMIHSGAWVAGIKLGDELWAEHQSGELDALSIGGFSFKTQVTTAAMPEVEFIDLQPSA